MTPEKSSSFEMVSERIVPNTFLLQKGNAIYPRIKKLKDGDYIMFFQDGRLGPNCYLSRSNDLKTWSEPEILFSSYETSDDTRAYATTDAVVLPDGDIIAVASYRAVKGYREGTGCGIVTRRSSDGGIATVQDGMVTDTGSFNLVTISREERIVSNEYYYSYVIAAGSPSFAAKDYLDSNAYANDELPLEALQGKKVVALSGIASPQSFENSLLKMGASILARERFSDHYRYRPQEILDIVNNADELGADYILTTEKDAVRLPHLENPKVPVYYMRMEIEILDGYENFRECVKRICFA